MRRIPGAAAACNPGTANARAKPACPVRGSSCPGCPQIRSESRSCLIQYGGMPSNRLEMIQQLLAQNPNDSFLLYGLANEYKNQGDLPKAIESYHDLMERNPDYVAAYYQCGQAYEKTGNEAAAAAVYDKGMEVARRLGDAHALSELQAARDILG